MLWRVLSSAAIVGVLLPGCSDDVGDVSDYCARARTVGEVDPFAAERIDVGDIGGVELELRAAVGRAEELLEVAPGRVEDEHETLVESAREALAAAEELGFDLQSAPGRSDVVIEAFDRAEAREASAAIAAFVEEHCDSASTTTLEPSPAEVDAIASLSAKELAVALEVTGLPNARALADAFREGEVEVEAIEAEIRERSAAAPQTLGDDEELDELWVACEEGTLGACDTLYEQSAIGTTYEQFGGSCGGRVAQRADGRCALLASQDGRAPTIDP